MRLLKRLVGSLAGGAAPAPARGAPRESGTDGDAEQSLRDALLRLNAGDLEGAEAACRRALAASPDEANAHYLLGSLLGQRGEHAGALEHLQRATELSPELAAAHVDMGNVHRLRGDVQGAEASYRRAIAIDGGLAMAHRNLGELLRELGRVHDAIECFARAAELAPDDVDVRFIHADLLASRGRFREAARSYEEGLRLAPGVAAAHNNLGASYRHLGRDRDALGAFEEALRLDPGLADAHANLADLLEARGDTAAALTHSRRVVERDPGSLEGRRRLGRLLLESGQREEAVQCYREALALAPERPQSHFELGNALMAVREAEEAIERYRQAVRLDPAYADAHVNLGFALNRANRFESAAECFREALRLDPELVEAHNNLGGVLQMQGRLEPAMRAYERALDIAPDAVYVRSNLLTCLNYHDEADPAEVFERHLEWGAMLEQLDAGDAAFVERSADPERRLRIGYVSADLRFHSVAFFIAAVIERHDRARFEVFCYANVASPDANTERLAAMADHWRDITALDDDELAARIRRDEIDLLVDLSGHTVGNRLAAFARRPAPVQVTYLGYPNTTGLRAIDYRLTDAAADPEGLTDRLYTETLVRLPRGFLCYRPPEDCPQIRELDAGEVVFASFNELLKVTPPVVCAWAELLDRVPGSRLLIKGTTLGDEGTRRHVVSRFEAHGVDAARVELVGRTPTLEAHLDLYNRVAVGLDTFPYNGTTTTCEALWMGVPVVTLAGEVHASRVGASLLPQVGLEDLVARDWREYVDKAAALAADAERRLALRRELRERMRGSSLMDEAAFTEELESAYRRMWRQWCEGAAAGARGTGADAARGMRIRVRDGLRVHVPRDTSRLTPYVLLEQEDWFEDEIGFVRRALEPGMSCVDVGASYGLYTLACAAAVGREGSVWAFEPTPATAASLARSLEENGLDNVRLMEVALSRAPGTAKLAVSDDPELNRLSAEAPPHGRFELVDVETLDGVAGRDGLGAVDFLKIDAEGAELDVLAGAGRCLASSAPLVLFELKHLDRFNWELVEALHALGLGSYRLLPGPQILVPFEREEADAYQLNLFACGDERARRLEGRGLLAREVPAAGAAQDAAHEALGSCLGRMPYARDLAPAWGAGAPDGRGGDLEAGLRQYCRGRRESLPPGQRVQALRAARAALASHETGEREVARLHCAARVAWELGRREEALEALEALLGAMARGDTLSPASPFVPACPAFDAIAPGDALAEWSLACALDQRERLRTFSSFIGGDARLADLERLAASPFQRPEMERRRQLVRMRTGEQTGPEPSPLLARETPDNLNPDFWTSQATP